MKVSGFALVDKWTGAQRVRWTQIPPRIELFNGDKCVLRLDGADATWQNDDFQIVPVSWDEPDPQPVRRLVLTSVIVDRLHDAKLLEAARAILDASDVYTRERWNTRTAIFADDPTAIGLLTAIGADPAVILAE